MLYNIKSDRGWPLKCNITLPHNPPTAKDSYDALLYAEYFKRFVSLNLRQARGLSTDSSLSTKFKKRFQCAEVDGEAITLAEVAQARVFGRPF